MTKPNWRKWSEEEPKPTNSPIVISNKWGERHNVAWNMYDGWCANDVNTDQRIPLENYDYVEWAEYDEVFGDD